MNYLKHYEQLMDRAKHRKLQGYSEKHHIIPKCLGGSNSRENIVRLTPEEHYVAHQLLVKMHPRNHRLVWALMNMTGASKRMHGRKNKIYGWVRRAFAAMIRLRETGRQWSPERRARKSAQQMGKNTGPRSAETRAKMSAASKGRKKSLAHRATMSAMRKGKSTGKQSAEWVAKRVQSTKLRGVDNAYRQTDEYRRLQSERTAQVWERRRAGLLPMPHTDEVKAKMSAAAKGREFSPEHRAALSAAKRAKSTLSEEDSPSPSTRR